MVEFQVRAGGRAYFGAEGVNLAAGVFHEAVASAGGHLRDFVGAEQAVLRLGDFVDAQAYFRLYQARQVQQLRSQPVGRWQQRERHDGDIRAHVVDSLKAVSLLGQGIAIVADGGRRHSPARMPGHVFSDAQALVVVEQQHLAGLPQRQHAGQFQIAVEIQQRADGGQIEPVVAIEGR